MYGAESPATVNAPPHSGAFLTQMIRQFDREERRRLCAELATAEREERCLRRAVFLMVVLLMVSVAGLAYCSLILPEVYQNPDHPLTECLTTLGLGSLISIMIFLGYLCWHRTAVNRLHGECRRIILELVQAKARERNSLKIVESVSALPSPSSTDS